MTCKPCPTITAGPKPYYEEVSESVVECHKTVVHQNIYAAGVLASEPWNVPEVNEDVAVQLEGVTIIPVGAYLYNPNYGYYLISQWNPKSGQVGLVNDGILGNAGPGTYVPANIPFLITPKPCCEDDTSSFFPFLAQDFTAPPINQSVTVEVTSTFGLTVGDFVRIGEGLYRLESINSTRQIEIFNSGGGHPLNTVVESRDGDNNFQYLITPEASFACTANDLVSAGRMIVCDGDEQKLLTGAAVGQVPVLQDPVTGDVAFESLGTLSIVDNSVTTVKLADGSVTEAKIANDAVTAEKIEAGAVGTAELADNSVNTNKIVDANVTTNKIADAAITNAKILAGAVTETKITDRSVTNLKIGIGAVGTGELALGAVNVDRIADGVVTNAKLNNGSVNSIKIATDAVLSNHIASFAQLGGVYTPTIAMEVSVTGLTPQGYYYIVGALILVHFSVSGTPSADFSTLSASLPTATASDGSPATALWPAIIEQWPVDNTDAEVAQMRRAATSWGILGGTTGAMDFWFAPQIPNGSFVKFSAWGLYPYK